MFGGGGRGSDTQRCSLKRYSNLLMLVLMNYVPATQSLLVTRTEYERKCACTEEITMLITVLPREAANHLADLFHHLEDK